MLEKSRKPPKGNSMSRYHSNSFPNGFTTGWFVLRQVDPSLFYLQMPGRTQVGGFIAENPRNYRMEGSVQPSFLWPSHSFGVHSQHGLGSQHTTQRYKKAMSPNLPFSPSANPHPFSLCLLRTTVFNAHARY